MTIRLRKKGRAGRSERDDLLSYHLHRLLAGREDGWRVHGIHASDVTNEDFCPRLYALLDMTASSPRRVMVSTASQVVFAQGRMHATMVIDWLARAGVAWGDWRCAGCSRLHRRQARPDRCAACGSRAFRYSELRVGSAASGIDGGIDLFAALPTRDKLLVVELKSCDKEKFKLLKMPLGEHRARTSLYLRLVDECGDGDLRNRVDLQEARILYVSKGGFGERSRDPKSWGLDDECWRPFKEFTVGRDDELTEEYVRLATPLHRFRSGGAIPAGTCRSALSSRAMRCEMREACFSGTYKAGAPRPS